MNDDDDDGDKNLISENLREQLDDKCSAVPLEIFKKTTKLKKSGHSVDRNQ